jgi:hypothetical protein
VANWTAIWQDIADQTASWHQDLAEFTASWQDVTNNWTARLG